MQTPHLSQFDYDLPPDRIAQTHAKPRDHSRLLVLDGATGALEHSRFDHLATLLRKGDVLVVNTSKVLPARLEGVKSTGGRVDILLVRDLGRNRWHAMLKNFSLREVGKTISIGKQGLLKAHVIEPMSDGLWTMRFSSRNGNTVPSLLKRYGKTPTPPYIARSHSLSDYQTVYAKEVGSVAAPTAGFHFTKRLMSALKKKGVIFCPVTLHVGPGTFLPIRDEDISRHRMHSEFASINARSAKIINGAKKDGRRVIAVGTTAVRTLESFADALGHIVPGAKDTRLFITLAYQFKIVDALITNFHLPRTTLLVLVASFAEWKKEGGRKRVLAAYDEAIKRKYRFYSFGDAMFIS